MRSFWVLSTTVFLVVLSAVTSVHWLGDRVSVPSFPLPDEGGCWDGLCVSALASPGLLLMHLFGHPGVVPGSPQLSSQQPGSVELRFQYQGSRGRVQPVLLLPEPAGYTLSRNWHAVNNPPLMRLGEVIAQLGPPDRVSLLSREAVLNYPPDQVTQYHLRPYQVVLHYIARHLQVTVRVAAWRPTFAQLYADTPVIALWVINPGDEEGAREAYYPPSWNWRGFGLYRTES